MSDRLPESGELAAKGHRENYGSYQFSLPKLMRPTGIRNSSNVIFQHGTSNHNCSSFRGILVAEVDRQLFPNR